MELQSLSSSPASQPSTTSESSQKPVNAQPRQNAHSQSKRIQWRLLWLILSQGVALFFFVIIPIITPLPYISEPWFGVGDLWKILDPLVTLPIFYFIFVHASRAQLNFLVDKDELEDVVDGQVPVSASSPAHPREAVRLHVFFMILAAIYVEGHGLHTAAAMFKDPIKALYTNQPQAAVDYPELKEIYSYIRDDWQHIYAHYIYAVGALGMTVVQMWAYRDQDMPNLTTWGSYIVFLASSFLFSLMFAGVCVNFPAGLIVGLIWLAIYALPWTVWLWLQRTSDLPNTTWNWDRRYQVFARNRLLFSPGRRLIPQYYLLSYAMSLVWIVIYICIFGFKDRASAGISLK